LGQTLWPTKGVVNKIIIASDLLKKNRHSFLEIGRHGRFDNKFAYVEVVALNIDPIIVEIFSKLGDTLKSRDNSRRHTRLKSHLKLGLEDLEM